MTRIDAERSILSSIFPKIRETYLHIASIEHMRCPDMQDDSYVFIPWQRAWKCLRRQFKEGKQGPEETIVHCHGPLAIIIARLGFRLGSRRPLMVYEIHGAMAYESLYRNRKGFARYVRFLLLYGLECLAIVCSDNLLSVSEEYARYYPLVRMKKRTSIPKYVSEHTSEELNQGTSKVQKFISERQARGLIGILYSGSARSWQLPMETMIVMKGLLESGRCFGLILSQEVQFFESLAVEMNADTSNLHIANVGANDLDKMIAQLNIGLLLRDDHVTNYVASPTKLFQYAHRGLHVVTTAAVRESNIVIERLGYGTVLNSLPRKKDETGVAQVILEDYDRSRGIHFPRGVRLEPFHIDCTSDQFKYLYNVT